MARQPPWRMTQQVRDKFLVVLMEVGPMERKKSLSRLIEFDKKVKAALERHFPNANMDMAMWHYKMWVVQCKKEQRQ